MEHILGNLHIRSTSGYSFWSLVNNNCGKIIWIFTSFLICHAQTDSNYFTFPNPTKVQFISGSTMGLYLAVVIPVDLPPTNAYVGFFIDSIQSLPSNETSFEYPPLVERGINRKFIYNSVENNIKSRGFPGKPCLLRAICEVSLHSLHEANGILGNIIHLVLTPSSSRDIGLSPKYGEAEKMGTHQDCSVYHKNCTISILDMISTFINY